MDEPELSDLDPRRIGLFLDVDGTLLDLAPRPDAVVVPETLIEVHPQWRGLRYFVYNDEIILVDPNTLQIVAIVTV